MAWAASAAPGSPSTWPRTSAGFAATGMWNGIPMKDISGRRFLSLWLRRLSTDRIARRDKLAPAPLVVAGAVGNALFLTGLNDAAARLGLVPGMPLADARAMFPALAVEAEDAKADAALLEALAGWCLRYTPLTGLAPPDGLVLDVSGCAHLFGG